MLEKFSYGRHETFPVRYGWLTKGLRHAEHKGTLVGDLDTADALGIGSKMVKSLQFWMEATGLINRGKVSASYELTDLGRIVLERDPDLELPGTWYFFHASLASCPGTVWSWFFNHYPERAFDRDGCVQAFLRFSKDRAKNAASPAVADKDVACLILAYASPMGGDVADPEDVSASPLRELRLLTRHERVDRLERGRPSKVPAEAVLACVSGMATRMGVDSQPYRAIANQAGGPGRLFNLSGEALEAALEECISAGQARPALLGDERHLVLVPKPSAEWLADYYDRVGARR